MILERNSKHIPIAFLEKSLDISQNVGRIAVKLKSNSSTGTGFLIDHNKLVTCDYILPSVELCENSVFQTNYRKNGDGSISKIIEYELAPDDFFITDKTLGLTIVSIKNSDKNFAKLEVSDTYADGQPIGILSHQLGGPIQLSFGEIIQNNSIEFLHNADTQPGSGGAPVFNVEGKVIGIHHRGGDIQSLYNAEDKIYANGAISSNSLITLINKHQNAFDDILLKPKELKHSLTEEVRGQKLEFDGYKQTNKRDAVFISYSHKDQSATDWVERIETYLTGIPTIGETRVWVDSKIDSGIDWRAEIDFALSKTKVAILLVGPYFLKSKFINEVELPKILSSQIEEGVKVIPIITHHVPYQISVLSKYQSFNDPDSPLQYGIDSGDSDRTIVKMVYKVNQIFENSSV